MRKRLLFILLTLLTLPVMSGCKPPSVVKVISPVDVSVGVGQTLPELPAQVEVVYSNGEREMADVEQWQITQARLWKDTTITGKVAGTDLPVTLQVVVQDKNALSLSEAELKSSDLLSAMEDKLRGNPQVRMYRVSPLKTQICYIYSTNPVLDAGQLVYCWEVGTASSQVLPILGINYYKLEWSADGAFLYAASASDVVGMFDVIDMTTHEQEVSLASYMSAKWSPNSHELLIAQPNQVELIVPIGDGCSFDLAIYNADTNETTIVLSGTADCIYSIVGWDGPDTVIYDREFVQDGTIERGLKLKPNR